MADPYDLLPYTEHAYVESHPDHLQVIAALSGFIPTVAATQTVPRVLELGCGRGGNLLPMAEAWPEARFVGIDRSPAQIRDASRIAHAAELSNVELVVADFTEGELPLGPFDFVICHGVYSWIEVASRRALLQCIRRCLSPTGIAFVSFNTLPGWYRKLAARDWMRFAARSSIAGGPRDALQWLGQVVSREHEAFRNDLNAVHERLLETDAAYLTHEYLAEEHHPVYASTFVSEAEAEGLRYLCDAMPSETALELLPDAVQARIVGLDTKSALTVADFARDTAFRRALLVRSDTSVVSMTRESRASEGLDPLAVIPLRVASRLRRKGNHEASDLETFEGAGITVQVSGVARRALRVLAENAPKSVACTELATTLGVTPESLATELFDLWLATGGIDFRVREPDFVSRVSRTPRASAVARWHARANDGGPVTNVWHQEVALAEPVVRFILGQLDGTRTVTDLTRLVRDHEQIQLSAAETSDVVEGALQLLARAALLIG